MCPTQSGAAYDYLVVGTGLFGAVCACELHKKGKRVLAVERRNHIGGNVYTEDMDGIHVHKYGAHIFHTNDKHVWEYVNAFAEFNRYTNSPLACHKGRLYNLPFNMNTFYQLWGTATPEAALEKLEEERAEMAGKEPQNLEEQAISLVGRTIYEVLIKGYTEKQWGRKATDLPAFIIRRLPLRLTFDNNYFSDRYQGIPVGGYTRLVERMLEGVDVRLGVDYLTRREQLSTLADTVIYTGPVDAYFGYCFGELEYRSLRFEEETLQTSNYQGNAVINYTERDVPYTRVIEHKHFDPVDTAHTAVTREYPADWQRGDEPYYPVNDETNTELYRRYAELADNEKTVIFGGRLAEYRYYDMHQVVASALTLVERL